MKKRLISFVLMLSMVFAMVPGMGIGVSAATGGPAVLTTPDIDPVLQTGVTYHGYYDGEVSYSSTLKVRWKDAGAAYYNVAIKALDGDPNPSDSEPGTFIYDYTTNFTGTYISLTKSELKSVAGQWVKVFIQPNYTDGTFTNCHYYFKVKSLTSLDKPDVTVESIGSSSSLQVSWDKVSGAAGYFIYRSTSTSSSTFKLVKTFSSGNTTSWTDTGLEANTKYYYKVKAFNDSVESSLSSYDSARTEKAGGAKFDHQPTVSLSIGGNSLGTDLYGIYYPGEDTIYLNCTVDYTDHIFIQTGSTSLTFWDPDGYKVSGGTFIENSSTSASVNRSYTNGENFQLQIPVPAGMAAGDYTITVTATDGVYDPETQTSIPGTAYYTAVKKSVTVRIGEKAAGGESAGPKITTLQQAKALVKYSTGNKKISVEKGYIRHMPQITGYTNFCDSYWINDEFDLTTNYNHDNVKIYKTNGEPKPYCHELCSRAAYSMALSYLGIDLTPVDMSSMVQSRGISGSYGNANPYQSVTEKLENVKHIVGSLDDLYSNYVNNDNYSPVYFHFSKPHCILIIGQKSENVYYVVDPSVRSNSNASMYNQHVYEMTLDKVNKKIVSFSYNGTEIFTSWGDYEYSYIHQWYLEDGQSPHTHSYTNIDYQPAHPHAKYTVCACGAIGAYTGTYETVAGCADCIAASQNTISGTIKSFNSNTDPITIRLLDVNGNQIKKTTVNGNTATYTLSADDGTYLLEFSKKNHTTRTYEITVSGNTTANGEIYLLGDITGDGKIGYYDLLRIKGTCLGIFSLTGYEYDVGDINGDGKYTSIDFARAKAHVLGTRKMY